MLTIAKDALQEIRAGLRMRAVWLALAHEDIGDQHRRTALGPVWLLLNYLTFVGTFIFLIGTSNSHYTYTAFLAVGLLVWFFIMDSITTSVSLFPSEEGFIKGTTLPLSIYVMRSYMRLVIRAGYALIGCAIILVYSGIHVTPTWLWSLLGVAIILCAAPAAIVVFAFLGVFFPDSQFLMPNIMRVGMFLTPVFWTYDGTGGIRHVFYYWNPFTYFLEIVRFPIVWGIVPLHAFLVSTLIGVGLWLVALLLLGTLRRKVVFAL